MRVSRAQATENRSRVIDVASRLFKRYGFDGIGLTALMKGAGLTQGGFYKQFNSKEDLAAKASSRAMESSAARWSSIIENNPKRPLSAIIGFYLSAEHRGEIAEGCPLVALGSDAARQSDEVKDAFDDGIKAHLNLIQAHLASDESNVSRERAMAILATMVGALMISRATKDETLSNDILSAALRQLHKRQFTVPPY